MPKRKKHRRETSKHGRLQRTRADVRVYFPTSSNKTSHLLSYDEAKQLFELLGVKARPDRPGYYWLPRTKAFSIIEAITSPKFEQYYGVKFDIQKVASWLLANFSVNRLAQIALSVHDEIRKLRQELREPNYRGRRREIEFALQRLHEFLYYLENPEAGKK
ncbi:MAG: hypothetical protein J7L14_01780 [Candidatus Diapherotrites archaeon]|nr:hypothetical protein [Candidatus Diapherotrites archaeon]